MPAWPPPRAFQPRPPLPIYAHIMLARPRTLPTGFIAPCLPTKTDKLPSGGQWLHEIKHDGFRIIARKDGERVRLYSRPGNDLTRRFPLIVDALSRLRSRSCIMQAWPCGPSSGSRRRSSSASIDEADRPCGPWHLID